MLQTTGIDITDICGLGLPKFVNIGPPKLACVWFSFGLGDAQLDRIGIPPAQHMLKRIRIHWQVKQLTKFS